MKRRHFPHALIFVAFVVFCESTVAAQVAVGSSLTVQVSDRDKTTADAIGKAESLGGYFSSLDEKSVVLKVPATKARDLIDFAKANWQPIEESYRAEEVVTTLDQLRASLKAKEQLYAQYAKLLANTEATEIVDVEASATKIISEIEVLKGQLRALQHRVDYATIVINFQLLERERPQDNTNSPFPWLNTLGLSTLLRGFEQ